jgi:hypothetical protein
MSVNNFDRIYEHLVTRTPEIPEIGWHSVESIERELGITYVYMSTWRHTCSWHSPEGEVRLQEMSPSSHGGGGLRLTGNEKYLTEVASAAELKCLRGLYQCLASGVPTTSENIAGYIGLAASTVTQYFVYLKWSHVTRTNKEYSFKFDPEQGIWFWSKDGGRLVSLVTAPVVSPITGTVPLSNVGLGEDCVAHVLLDPRWRVLATAISILEKEGVELSVAGVRRTALFLSRVGGDCELKFLVQMLRMEASAS